eukprot:TRINITY_DN4053_c0_g1_i3.p1 TRINITY_DN4053_c0_g1~~TRINITY_DN4053_c0_g1_i3.p1  ORF type:complete len:241 (+),score=-12.94 TRINITY_DN4053_c0_g1_i3:97-819(+)
MIVLCNNLLNNLFKFELFKFGVQNIQLQNVVIKIDFKKNIIEILWEITIFCRQQQQVPDTFYYYYIYLVRQVFSISLVFCVCILYVQDVDGGWACVGIDELRGGCRQYIICFIFLILAFISLFSRTHHYLIYVLMLIQVVYFGVFERLVKQVCLSKSLVQLNNDICVTQPHIPHLGYFQVISNPSKHQAICKNIPQGFFCVSWQLVMLTYFNIICKKYVCMYMGAQYVFVFNEFCYLLSD